MRLKELRESKGLYQKDVAQHLNCSTPVYCRYENGTREPSNEILSTLADFYGVSVDYLIGRDHPVDPVKPNATAPRAAHRAEGHEMLDQLSDENYEAMLILFRSIAEREG